MCPFCSGGSYRYSKIRNLPEVPGKQVAETENERIGRIQPQTSVIIASGAVEIYFDGSQCS